MTDSGNMSDGASGEEAAATDSGNGSGADTAHGDPARDEHAGSGKDQETESSVDQAEQDNSESLGGEEAAAAGTSRRQINENEDRYLRLLAEFENYKKRALKERSDLLKYQGEKIFVDLLGVIDDFELAMKHASANPEQLRTGVEMIHRKFVDVLSKWEVRSESGVGQQFDPAKHQAISRLKVDGQPAGTVLDELKKVYFYKDKMLRVGEVVVASAE